MAIAVHSSPLVVVPLTEQDLPAALTIQEESFPIPWNERQFRDEMALRWSHVDALKNPKTGEVLATACWWTVADEAQILNIATATDHRRRGHGRQLLQQLLARATDLGCTQASLEVRVSNAAAVGFYQRFGFESIGRRPKYYRDNSEDALILARDL
jgi:ribosomal-protein-alanine N-acetyltransferase